MSRRHLGGLVAACLAVTVGVAGLAGPAQAARPRTEAEAQSVQAAVFGFDWVSLVVAVVGALSSGGGGGGGSALDEAVRQIVAAVEQAKNEIIAHTDAVAAADVQACVRSATIEAANMEAFPPPVLILWAQEATSCAELATSYLGALVTPAAVDNVGSLVGPIFAVVFAARAKAGLVNGLDLILQDEIRAYEAVVAKLTPTDCRKWRAKEPGYPVEKWWECHAYNGDLGVSDVVVGNLREPDRAQAEDRATRNTSRAVAKDALPRLREAPLPVM
ncbi:MAG: hypothetical protein IRZ05_17015 [Micromonosporaceae bacterium]|nr:hypothetical protein [Micromonosporaceae bacterium]